MTDSNAPCVVPTTTGRSCTNEPLPAAPFPLCGKHAAEVLAFVNTAGGIGGRRVVDVGFKVRARGVVYYLRVGQHIKVGFTTNLDQRMRAYPPDAEILATEPGTPALERQRHQQFAHALSMGLEWFQPTADLLDHIEGVRKLTPADWAKAQGPMHPDGVSYVRGRLASDHGRM